MQPDLATLKEIYSPYGELKRKTGVIPGADVFELRGVHTGLGVPVSDMEIMGRAVRLFGDPNIFIIGNAFGLSAIALGLASPDSLIDVIDAEVEGSQNSEGSRITREIASKLDLDLQLTIGHSPQDTAKAMRAPEYHIVFIDGKHSHEQMKADFDSVEPYLADNCVVFFHDVGLCRMESAFRELQAKYGYKYQYIEKIPSSDSGMAAIYRGVSYALIEKGVTI